MSNVVITEPETTPEPVVVVADTSDDDAVLESAALDHTERITRLEDALALVTAALEALSEQVQALVTVDEIQEMEIQQVAENVDEVAESAADAVEEVVEDVEEASPEITPDEVPTVREHFFFRKWGKR